MSPGRIVWVTLAVVTGLFSSVSQAGVISAGAPTTSVPMYLSDGFYPFGTLIYPPINTRIT